MTVSPRVHFASAHVIGGLDDRGDVLPARTSAQGRATDDGRSGSCAGDYSTTDTLYLGVIKQTGTSGFYKVTVSEQ